jgi:HEAT repeat protein
MTTDLSSDAKASRLMSRLVFDLCAKSGPALEAAIDRLKSIENRRADGLLIGKLMERLKGQDEARVEQAATILVLFGEIAVPSAYRKMLDSSNRTLRFRLTNVLSRIGSEVVRNVGPPPLPDWLTGKYDEAAIKSECQGTPFRSSMALACQ